MLGITALSLLLSITVNTVWQGDQAASTPMPGSFLHSDGIVKQVAPTPTPAPPPPATTTAAAA